MEFTDKYTKLLQVAFKQTKNQKIFIDSFNDAPKLSGFNKPGDVPSTGLEENEIKSIGSIHSSFPPGDFLIHNEVAKALKRRSLLLQHKFINWSLAEAIAFGSLLKRGIHIRLSGLIQKNMWKNRHYVIHHQKKENTYYIPIDFVDPTQAKFSIHNYTSSQEALLAFEIGYSQCDPNVLVVYNAKDGNLNIPQTIIDEYLSCGIEKWKKPCGIVINLPHGRSVTSISTSSKPERFLQLCSNDDFIEMDYQQQLFNSNWIITYPTTPANLFHLLRRQILMPFRRPLINFLPRNLIETDANLSQFEDVTTNTSFKRIISEDVDPKLIDTVVFCCGKVFYDFAAIRQKENKENITFIRIEQIYPFPYDLLKEEINKYPNAKFVFAQEEPWNMGFHQYCVPKLQNILNKDEIKVITTPSALQNYNHSEDFLNNQKMKKEILTLNKITSDFVLS